MHGIPCALGRRAYLSVGRQVGALWLEHLAVFVLSLPHPLLSTVYQCDGCLSYLGRAGSWLGCQVLPAISAVSILELVASSGSSRMSRAPNLHSLRWGDEVFYIHQHIYLPYQAVANNKRFFKALLDAKPEENLAILSVQ